MGSFSDQISTMLFMSTVCIVLQKGDSSNITNTQGLNSSDFFNTIKQSSYPPGNINRTTHSVRKELPHTGSDTRLDYSYYYNMSYNDYYDYGDEYMYPGFPFERPMYLYIWVILVILTFLVNIVVVSVLLRKNMRSATNFILAAIAISDTLTGLVTLPTYIMVYHKYDPLQDYTYDNYTFGNITNNEFITLPWSAYANNFSFNQEFGISSDENQDMTFVSTTSMYGEVPNYDHYATHPPLDGYILTKDLCRGFMISKYFLSKSFHSVSIFLTLFLGIHRHISVAFPFKSQSMFTVNKTIIFCVIIFLLSPLLHAYHLATDKAVEGLCQWRIDGDGCVGYCIYLWVLFIIRHFIPCVSLTTFTILNLRLGTTFGRMDSNASELSRREEENRRISIIVTTIVVVFLIPEIPYGIFLLYSAIVKTMNEESKFDLETNRGIHMAYELLLVLTFNANFYIYTFLNNKFRKCLYGTYIKPIQRLFGDT